MPRPPKPHAALKLSGSWRASSRSKSEPPREDGSPLCPEWLDDVAKAAWADWLPRLEAMKVLSLADRDALAIMCDTWSRYLEARSKVLDQGEVVVITREDGSVASVRRNPWSAVLAEHGDRLRRMMGEFGLTPVGRARVGAAKENQGATKQEDIFTKRA